jgi:cytochrome c biogenesis protein CcdA/thiol-disulfide isomerase/thioredoxin
MLVLLAFAFVSGVITILSPCILPVLPIVLSGGVGGGKARPFGVVAGFVASFTFFTLALTAVVQALGIPPDALRIVAVVLIVVFGLVLLVPRLRDGFERISSRIASRGAAGANRQGAKQRTGFWGGLPVGISLGLIWTPCVGPIMASVITLALTQKVDGGAVFITLAYTLGTAIPMLAVMLGGRALLNRVPVLTRNTAGIQKVFGAVMIMVGVSIGLGWDRKVQTALLRAFPSYGSGLTAVENSGTVRGALQARTIAGPRTTAAGSGPVTAASGPAHPASYEVEPQNGTLGDYGPAPEIVTTGAWLNTEGISRAAPGGGAATPAGAAPLLMGDLRGRVVLVDFWTYSCVNCVRTLPYLKAWYDAYRDKGLVIIGVHTPEFEFEKSAANVARAVKELGVTWPVVQDNQYAQWNAYANHYWPAHFFIDARGRVRYFHFGEGAYDTSEKVIRALLREAGAALADGVSRPAPQPAAGTPETYLGYGRGRGFASAVVPVMDRPAEYRPARSPGNGEWNLSGRWTINSQYVVPESSGILELGFNARSVYLVVEPDGAGGSIHVLVDGHAGADTRDVHGGELTPSSSRLYQVVGLPEQGRHTLHLDVQGKLRLFAFTFG